MKVSIVTISYNQSEFLEQAIVSVLDQNYHDIEYIVIDAGSTDGSRGIIEKHRHRIDKVIFETDEGPADGLNKGFSIATGHIYGFLNSDDFLLPGVITKMVDAFNKNKHIDVISADTLLVDENNTLIRKLYSDTFSLIRYAYGANFIAQQSTFFKSSLFKAVAGFNSLNQCSWDGELFVDLALAGGRFSVVRDFWSGFRAHKHSISCSGKRDQEFNDYQKRIFVKIMQRELKPIDLITKFYHRMIKHLLNPRGIVSRVNKNTGHL
jgi:glycosyltransferase involved in cell wall biosynthesis